MRLSECQTQIGWLSRLLKWLDLHYLQEGEISPDNVLVLRHFICFKSQFGNSFFGREEGEFLLCNMFFPQVSAAAFSSLPAVVRDVKQCPTVKKTVNKK